MKSVILMLVLAVMSAPAFASKARLNSLGQDGYNGSFFINDNRNVWYNPANLNNIGNMIALEWGQETAGNSTAEGAVFMKHGNLNYGVSFGHEGKINGLRNSFGGQNANDILDVFVAGDAGVKWGANAYVGWAKDSVNATKEKVAGMRFGVNAGDLEVFTTLSLINIVENAAGTDLFKGKFGGQLGATYKLDAVKFYGIVKHFATKLPLNTNSTELTLGAGYTKDLNDKAKFYANSDFNYTKIKNAGSTWYVPMTIGLEVMTTKWLALRGYASQTFHTNDLATQGNTTSVGAGASVKFDGGMTIDGSFGTAGKSELGFSDDFLSTVSFNYAF